MNAIQLKAINENPVYKSFLETGVCQYNITRDEGKTWSKCEKEETK